MCGQDDCHARGSEFTQQLPGGTSSVRVEAGRIEEVWDNVDPFAIYTQLGVIAPPGSAALDR